MKDTSSRRIFLKSSAASIAAGYLALPAVAENSNPKGNIKYKLTLDILKKSYKSEFTASKRYTAFADKALEEKYPNIAYTFTALSFSEDIHALRFADVLKTLGSSVEKVKPKFTVKSTKENLENAAAKEMGKIQNYYPEIIRILNREGHDEAIVSAMYALKGHRQHEEDIKQIARFAGVFFGPVSKHIEKKTLDFHVCRNCGSTLEVPPNLACEICNRSISHYLRIKRK